MSELSLSALETEIAADLSRLDIGQAMHRVRSFAERIINDSESIADVLASRDLDAQCEAIAAAYYNKDAAVVERGEARRGTIILASELARAGGHVELIKDYVALGLFELPVRVVLTDLFNRIDAVSVAQWSDSIGCEVHTVDAVDLHGKLAGVDAYLAQWLPSTLLLMGHNQDVVSVVAGHAPGPMQRFFIHHGDHHLSLGVTCAAFCHVDTHNMAFENCRHQHQVVHQRYWPIASVRQGASKSSFLERGVLTTGSCGRGTKFEAGTYFFRYEIAIALVLKVTGGYHVHIGDLTPDFLERIGSALDKEGIPRDRFIHVEWVELLGRALCDYGVDVYIPSFPLGGGKALIEAMAIGMPVVLHESYRSLLLCGWGIAYPDAFKWRVYTDIPAIFQQIDLPTLETHSALAMTHFQQHYSTEAFLAAFEKGEASEVLVPPIPPYRGNPLYQYLDTRIARERTALAAMLENERLMRQWKLLNTEYLARDEAVRTQAKVIEDLVYKQQWQAQQAERFGGLAALWDLWNKRFLHRVKSNGDRGPA